MIKNALIIFFTIVLANLSFSCGDPDSALFRDTFEALSKDSVVLSEDGHLEGNFILTLKSYGLSSGFVRLNSDEILSPSDFKNADFERHINVGLYNTNTIEAEVRGKPGDKLCLSVYEDQVEGPDRLIYERCLIRTTGKPNGLLIEFLSND